MNLASIQTSIYRRTQTSATTFSNADMIVAINAANERVHSLIRPYLDNFKPTAWTTSDLSTGTAEPKFDAMFHDLIPLWVAFERAAEREQPTADGFQYQIEAKEKELLLFY